VDVGFDQTGATEEPGSVMARCICRDRGFDSGNATFRDAYINSSVF
jgi:hypothetical protein